MIVGHREVITTAAAVVAMVLDAVTGAILGEAEPGIGELLPSPEAPVTIHAPGGSGGLGRDAGAGGGCHG